MSFLVSTWLICAAAPPVSVLEPMPGLIPRSIGPAVMGGRIPTLAVVEKDPAIQYLGAASGGVWKTTDEGKTWTCVFAGQPHASIGAIALAPSNPEVVWVGTGEANPRNSVCWGNGVFVSRDAGKTWIHTGLEQTHHIGKIAVHPKNPDIAYVAALGHLWGPNPERGLFGTHDGGKTWTHLLRLDQDTGCIDVVIDPAEPQTIFAAAYRVRRDGFSGGNPAEQFGPLAGVYRSRDGGKSWKRLIRGLPSNAIGRVGLAISRKNPSLLYAVVQTDRTDIRQITGQAQGYGPVESGGIFFSRDSGDTWHKINNLCPRPFYFSKIRIDPVEERRIYVLGIPLYVSYDGGRSFHAEGARGVHVDHHDLWINPADPRHLVLGNDGGLYYSHDGGANWTPINNLPISQFYAVAADRRKPFHLYGGLQDNGTWGGPNQTEHPWGILNDDWKRVLDMDGFHCQVPPDDPQTVYAEGQYGRLYRLELALRRSVSIRPTSRRADAPAYRFNWSAPLLLSAHDTKTLYYGGNQLFKSTDRGDTWRIISPELTRGQAGVRYAHTGHTLTALAESPLREGLVYTGSDDGKIHLTRDDGRTWTDLSSRLAVPEGGWITRLVCSPHAEGTVWVSMDRHRQDDRRPYLFRSDDYGQTWKSLVANLPGECPVHVVRVDERNPDLLYLGTEFGLFISLDGGGYWQRWTERLPTCPVHDLLVHPQTRELIVATHGRGIYLVDVSPLQELTSKVRTRAVHLFEVPSVVLRKPSKPLPVPERTYLGENPIPGAKIWYRLGRTVSAAVQVELVTPTGRVVAQWAGAQERGIHRIVWDLKDRDGTMVAPGEWIVRLRVGEEVRQTTLRLTLGERD